MEEEDRVKRDEVMRAARGPRAARSAAAGGVAADTVAGSHSHPEHSVIGEQRL